MNKKQMSEMGGDNALTSLIIAVYFTNSNMRGGRRCV